MKLNFEGRFDIMKKYYVQNNKIIINKYCIKYTYSVNNPNSETKSEVIQYVGSDKELNALITELNQKNIDFNVTELDVDDILEYNGLIVENDEEARKLIEPSLDEVKNDKIEEISKNCKQKIYNGIDVTLSDGSVKHFSLKAEDQININSLVNQISLGNIKAENGVPYHSDGELCALFSIADFTLIANSAMSFILQQTTYCNHLMNYVRSLVSINDIKYVEYGQELSGKFLESYNNIIKADSNEK